MSMKGSRFVKDGRSRGQHGSRFLHGLIFLFTSASCLDSLARDVEIQVIDGVTTARSIPQPRDGAGGGVSPLTNGDFSAGLEGWSAKQTGGSAAPGSVTAEEGAAILREGDSFLVTLSQELVVPEKAKSLSFTVRLEPGFDVTSESIPDAFEVSLLDADLLPVTRSWSDTSTSFLNFQEDGTVHTGEGVTWNGDRATLDLTGLAEGSAVTLYFDLIGADADLASAVRIDDVEVSLRRDEGFIRGNPNLDGAVNITDPIVILNYLFLGTSTINCPDAADTNNDGVLNITDPIYLLGYLFLGTDPIPAPYPSCGLDEGPEDSLGCAPCSCPGSAEGGNCP